MAEQLSRTLVLYEHGTEELPADIDQKELEAYLQEVWRARDQFFEYSTAEKAAEEESRFVDKRGQGILEFVGERKIKARNYVGFLQFGGYDILIWPKVFGKFSKRKGWDNLSNDNHNLFLQHLLFYFSYCRRIRFPFSQVHAELDRSESLMEALVRIFGNYTESVLSRQPFQRYEEVTEELSYMRGRIAMPEYVSRNLSTGRWQYLHCTYEPFVYDNLFNQVVKYTSRLLADRMPKSIPSLDNIQFLLDEVEDRVCTVYDCDKVKFNPLYAELQTILDMCRMFLAMEQTGYGRQERRSFCFILPMEYVFEDFLAGYLQENFNDVWDVTYQASDRRLTDCRTFMLQHDILLRHRTNHWNIILDAKYKQRQQTKDDPKRGIAQDDMYQMLAYISRRENCSLAYLLYPDTKQGISEKPFDVSISSPQAGKVNIGARNFCIVADELDDLKNSFHEEVSGFLDILIAFHK